MTKKLKHATLTAISIDGDEYEAKDGVFTFKKDEHADIAAALYPGFEPATAAAPAKTDGGQGGGEGAPK